MSSQEGRRVKGEGARREKQFSITPTFMQICTARSPHLHCTSRLIIGAQGRKKSSPASPNLACRPVRSIARSAHLHFRVLAGCGGPREVAHVIQVLVMVELWVHCLLCIMGAKVSTRKAFRYWQQPSAGCRILRKRGVPGWTKKFHAQPRDQHLIGTHQLGMQVEHKAILDGAVLCSCPFLTAALLHGEKG